jgi:hypothetical protein
MDEHLVFYIDLLGFQEAVRTWEKEKIERLAKMLHDFASWRPESEPPVITTFSDHIVMSYPLDYLTKWKPNGDLGIGLMIAEPFIARLASAAAALDFLIRGGITVGPLYHSRGVVFGEAMNEAYYLESRVSSYPRIAVSRKVYSRVGPGQQIHLLRDDDGIVHYNYFLTMIMNLPQSEQPTKSPALRYAEVQRVIDENIDKFEREERWNELAKWAWFQNRFGRSAAGFLNSFREREPEAFEEMERRQASRLRYGMLD